MIFIGRIYVIVDDVQTLITTDDNSFKIMYKDIEILKVKVLLS